MKTTALTRKLSTMAPWEVYRAAIAGETKAFAYATGISVSTVEKYQREPASDEAPDASGVVSPLARILRDMSALHEVCGPDAVAVLVDYIRLHQLRLRGGVEKQMDDEERARLLEMRDYINRQLYQAGYDRTVQIVSVNKVA